MADSWDSPVDDVNNKLNSLQITEETDFSDEVDLNAKKSSKPKQKINTSASSPTTNNAPLTSGKLLDRIRTNVDVALLNALDNPRDRLNLLKAEDELVKFMRNPRLTHHEFPPMSSYHRLLLHRLAQRFSLVHTAVDMPTYTQYGQYTGECCKIIVTKAEQSSTPRFLLVHIAQLQNQKRNVKQKKVLMMKRRTKGPTASQNRNKRGGKAGAKSDAQKSIEERERAYAQARARIFGDNSGEGGAGDSDVKPDPVSPMTDASTTSSPRGPSLSTSKSSPASKSAAPATSRPRGPPAPRLSDRERAEYARGPDPKTVGFYGAGRGRGTGPGASVYSRGPSRNPRGYERAYRPRPHEHQHNAMAPPLPSSNSHRYPSDMHRRMGPPDHPQYYHAQPMSQMGPPPHMGYMPAGPRGPAHMQPSPVHPDQPRNDAFDRSYNLYRAPMYYPSPDDNYNQNFPTLRR